MTDGLLRRQGHGSLPAGECRRWVLAFVVQLGEKSPVIRVGWLQLDRLLEPDHGIVDLPFALQDQAEVGMGRSEIGLKANGFEIRRPGLLPRL